MRMLLRLVPWWARIVAVGAVLVASAAFGAVKMHQHDQKAYDALQKRFDDFQDQVRVNGLAAKAATKAKEEADLKRKKDADEENAHALATLAGTIAKLRADGAGRRPVSRPAPCPGNTAGASRYWTEFVGAYRDLLQEVRDAAAKGDGTTVGLNAAKRWAQH